jgi:hypothetical protein
MKWRRETTEALLISRPAQSGDLSMKLMIQRFCATVCLLAVVVSYGCKRSGMEKVVVRGEVTYAGEPIANGQIRFAPIEGTKGPISGGVIKDGKYEAQGKGGVPLGKHRVEIYGYRPTKKAPGGLQNEGGDSEQFIPAKYSGGSSLTTMITAQSASEPLNFKLDP